MRRDARASRAALLEAAWVEFGRHGPDVPLTTVAQTAGVGIATLYRHFPRRADLVGGLVGEVMDRIEQVTDDHIARWDEDPPAVWAAFVRTLADLQVSALVIPLAVHQLRDELPGEVLRRRQRAMARIERLLVRARAAGLVREGVDAVRFTISLAAVARPMPPMALERVPDQPDFLLDLFLRGLRPDPA